MRRWAALPLVAAIALLATACPSSDPVPGATSSPPRPDDSLTPVTGGTLVVGVRELPSLDPAVASSSGGSRGSLAVVAQIFDPLTRIDPETGSVIPAAAKSWDISKDGLRWRFNLPKRKFHDGTLVRATDFEFAFDRITRRSTRSDAAFQLEQVNGFRRVKIDGTTNQLAGVSAPDPFTLVIELGRPFAELAYNLAHPALGPLPKATYGRSTKGLARTPVGNGPFRVKRSTSKRALIVPFADHHRDRPYVNAVAFEVSPTVEKGWQRYTDGAVHVAEVPPTAIDGGDAVFGDGGFTPFWATLSFGFNTKRPAFRKAEVRRAISLSIDRGAIAARVYGDTRDPATGIVPAGVRGYVPGACEACVFDRTRAQAVIDAAFPKKKPRIGIDFLNERSSRRVAAALRADIRRLGFTVELRPHPRRRYLDILESGDHDLAQLGWLSDVPSPDPFLHQQLRTNQLNNHTGWSNATFDRRLDRARREKREEQRLTHYRVAEAIALREMPMLPIVFFRNRTAVSPQVHGLELDGAGLFDAAQVWIEA